METLIERIQRHEGFRSVPYRDSLGHWTIGIGTLITEDQAQELAHGVSYEWAYDRMVNDLQKMRKDLLTTYPWMSELSAIRLDTFTEMAYQLGVAGLMKFHDMLYCARSNDPEGVAREMLNSLWHRQTPARCEELADLYLANGEENGS